MGGGNGKGETGKGQLGRGQQEGGDGEGGKGKEENEGQEEGDFTDEYNGMPGWT